DVDGADRLGVSVAGDHEGQVDDDVATGESLAQRIGIANVTLAIAHLAPAMGGRVEGPAGDPDDPGDARALLKQRDQAGAEGTGGPGDRDLETSSRVRHMALVPAVRVSPTCLRATIS